ncbi:MAG: dihydrolipoyl dehydrogenase [Proteobacteria bacterium]|nr:dihydrolipoyl dehydrogenase [Pseudomonadota bacterium]
MAAQLFDLIVIGAGPGGYVGAIRAAQLGLKVALIEKFPHLGGTCLNVGCIPTKALLESAKIWDKLGHAEELGFDIGAPKFSWQKIMGRKNKIVDDQRKGLRFLMKKNKIEVFEGHGRITSKGKVSVTAADGKVTALETINIMIATGSRVRELPFAKSNGTGIMTSDDVLFIETVPKTMAIIGGGVVGVEFASLFGRFGTQVTVIEMAPQILPFEDEECSKELARCLKKQNVLIETSTKLSAVEDRGHEGVMVTTEGQVARKFDKVLVSIGRAPVTEDIGLSSIGLSTERGQIKVDFATYKTAVDGVYAIGDVLSTPMLAHTASAEAYHCAEVIAGKKPHKVHYESNPSAVYTYPEVASIGMTERELKEKGIEYKIGKFPFAPMAKAKIEDATDGFVKILFEPKFREILGVHIVNARATEMIAEFSLAKVLESTLDEIAHTIHPHPTLSETIMEAAHAGLGGAVHL